MMLRYLGVLAPARGRGRCRQMVARGLAKKRRTLKKKLEEEGPSEEVRAKARAPGELLQHYFFLQVNSDGSTMPVLYGKERFPKVNYQVETEDIFSNPEYQKITEKPIVTTDDDMAMKKIREKYGIPEPVVPES